MIVLDTQNYKIQIKTCNINKIYLKYCIGIAQNILHVLQIPNFNGEHSDMPIHKTLEKS